MFLSSICFLLMIYLCAGNDITVTVLHGQANPSAAEMDDENLRTTVKCFVSGTENMKDIRNLLISRKKISASNWTSLAEVENGKRADFVHTVPRLARDIVFRNPDVNGSIEASREGLKGYLTLVMDFRLEMCRDLVYRCTLRYKNVSNNYKTEVGYETCQQHGIRNGIRGLQEKVFTGMILRIAALCVCLISSPKLNI